MSHARVVSNERARPVQHRCGGSPQCARRPSFAWLAAFLTRQKSPGVAHWHRAEKRALPSRRGLRRQSGWVLTENVAKLPMAGRFWGLNFGSTRSPRRHAEAWNVACIRNWVTLGDRVTHATLQHGMNMAQTEASRQFSFRLPVSLVERIEACTENIREKGLDVSRADVVRLLLSHSLETTKCELNLLLRPTDGKSTSRRRRE
jgi:hypothetical protein